MTTSLISFPPRLGPQGNFVTLDDDNSDYYAEELALLLLIRPGERPQAPDFGTSDPVFDQVDGNEFALKVAMFGPPVNIIDVMTYPLGDNRQDVTVQFEPADLEQIETRTPITDTQNGDVA